MYSSSKTCLWLRPLSWPESYPQPIRLWLIFAASPNSYGIRVPQEPNLVHKHYFLLRWGLSIVFPSQHQVCHRANLAHLLSQVGKALTFVKVAFERKLEASCCEDWYWCSHCSFAYQIYSDKYKIKVCLSCYVFNSPSSPETAGWLPWLWPCTLTCMQWWRPSPAVPPAQSTALQAHSCAAQVWCPLHGLNLLRWGCHPAELWLSMLKLGCCWGHANEVGLEAVLASSVIFQCV